MLADHRRQFRAVLLRHADIDENDGDIVLEQTFQGFRADAALMRFSPRSRRMTS
jgi:hypothetical protein